MPMRTPQKTIVETKTGETVTKPGMYTTNCCEEEKIFSKDDTFTRCPKCRELCDWEDTHQIIDR